MDIASLGIKVTTSGTKEASADLDNLAASGARAEQSVKRIAPVSKTSSEALALFAKIDPLAGKLQKFDALESSLRNLSKAGKVGATDFAAMSATLDASRDRLLGIKKEADGATLALSLFAKIDPNAGKLQKLDGLEKELKSLAAAGHVGALDFATMSVKISDSRKAIISGGKAVEQAGGSVAKFTSNTRLMSEASTIASDVVSGQFGRIRRSAAAMANASGVLRLAFTGTGAAVLGLTAVLGALAYAWNEASEREHAFDKGLILTGNYAHTTAKDLSAMAAQLSASTDATTGKATEVLAQVAASGQFTAQQMALVSKAALQMEEATGQSIDNTVKQFDSLKEAPTAYILKLNDVGQVTHFLTQETLDAIEKLEDQGRTTDAAALAMKAYADAINTRAPEVLEHLGAFQTALRLIKQGAGDLGDSIVKAMGQADTAINGTLASIAAASQRTKSLIFSLPGGATLLGVAGAITGAQRKPFDATKPSGAPSSDIVDSPKAEATRQARINFDKLHDRYLTRAQQLEAALTEAQNLGVTAGKSQLEIDKQKAAIRASFEAKQRKPRQESANAIQEGRDRFDDMTARFQSELDGPVKKAEEEHIRRMRELTEAAAKGKVGHDALAASLALESQAYAKTTDDIKNQIDTQVAGFLGPVAQAQQAHINALRDIEDLTKKGAINATQHAQALDEEARAYRGDMEAAKRAQEPMQALLDDMKYELDTIGKSNSERAVMNELRREGIDIMSQEGQAALAVARTYEQEAQAKQRSIDLMDDFRRGAADALSEFVTGAKSAKDALKDFFNELAKEITQAIAQQWMQKLFGQQGTSQSGSAGGSWIGAIASMFGGGSANGNAFVNGQMQAFANGGVVNSPTFFGMSGGKFGVMGEGNKPEAILPLHRGPDGKLGVRMEAANDDRQRPVQTFNTTFLMPERYSRETQAQIDQKRDRVGRRAASRNS